MLRYVREWQTDVGFVYACSFCNERRFASTAALVAHLCARHCSNSSGAMALICRFCPSVFDNLPARMRHERTDCRSAVLRFFTSLQHRIEKHSATADINIVASSHDAAAAGDAGKANKLSSSSSLMPINKTTSPTVSTGAVSVTMSRRVSGDGGGAVGNTAVRQKSSTDVVVISDDEVDNDNRLQHLDVVVSRRNANQSETTSTALFKCYYCVAVFQRRQQLLKHIAGHFCDYSETQMLPVIIGSGGEGRTKYHCVFCDEKALYSRILLTKHIYSCHLKNMRHHCTLCESPPYLKWSLHNCVAAGQTPTWSHRCVRCRWRFKSAQDGVRHHEENHKAHAIQCLKCNVRCGSTEKILEHELEET